MKMSKICWERRHAKQRAFERYGIVMNRRLLTALVQQIRSGKAVFKTKQSCTRSVFQATIKGVSCQVVYDKKRKMVVTFLPPQGNN